MVYRFRVILDAEEDVFRDIEIEQNATLEDFHNAITQAFGFDGSEMASFYKSDDKWDQGAEISLFDMGETEGTTQLMQDTLLETVTHVNATRLIYVYDFLSMWTFLVELADIAEKEAGREYPNLLFSHGELPDSPPVKNFESDDRVDFGEEEPRIEFTDLDEYNDSALNYNWN